MAVPLRPLYIDIPGAGTARVYIDIIGDQFSEASRIWPQVDFKTAGTTEFTATDELQVIINRGGFANVPQFIERALKYSGVAYPVIEWTNTTSIRQFIEWFLAKPKTEVDAMLAKWAKESLLPWLAGIVTEMLAPVLGSLSTPVGVYQNVFDALNAQLDGARVTIANGAVSLTK